MDSQSSKAIRGPSFTHEEDFAITKSWLDISEDACVGTDQARSTYWERVFVYFNQLMGNPPNTTRNPKTIANRWFKIQAQMNKFSGILTNLEAKYVSGKSPGDKLIDAQIVFRQQENKNWILQKCWDHVKDTAKWKNIPAMPPKKTKKKAVVTSNVLENEGSTPSTPSTPNSTIPVTFNQNFELNQNFDSTQGFHSLERPDGQKKAKEKRKLSQEDSIHEFKESNEVFKSFMNTWTQRSAKLEEFEAKKIENEAKRIENDSKKMEALALREQRKQDKIRAKQEQQDRDIMNMSLDGLSQVQRQFFEMEQKRVLDKYLYGGDRDIGGSGSGGC